MIRESLLVCFGSGILVAAFAAATAAEVVELRDGRRIEGRLRQATSTAVTIDTGGQLLTFPADQVRAVYYDQTPVVSLKAGPNAAREGLAALQALRSTLSGGVNYREYGTRLNEVRPKIERLGRDGTVPPHVQHALEKALSYYATAASAWESSVRNRAGLVDDAAMATLQKDRCPELQALRSRERGSVLSAVWICAGDAIDEAEKLVK